MRFQLRIKLSEKKMGRIEKNVRYVTGGTDLFDNAIFVRDLSAVEYRVVQSRYYLWLMGRSGYSIGRD